MAAPQPKTSNWRVAILIPAFLLIGGATALFAEVSVNFAHLTLVYGFEPVANGTIYFASTKQLVVSNGDRLKGSHCFWHFVGILVLWLGPFLLLFLPIVKWAGKGIPRTTT